MRKKYNSGLLIFLSLFVTVFVVIPMISSCGKSGAANAATLNIQMQIINLSPDQGSVDLYFKYIKANTSSYFYPSASGYFYLTSIDTPIQFRPGTSAVTGTVTSSGNLFPNIDSVLKPGVKYTIFITGLKSVDSVSYLFSADTSSTPKIGLGKIRFINLSPRSSGFDITANDTLAFTNVTFGSKSPFKNLPAGTYDFKIYPHGTSTLIKDIPNITLQDGRIYTMYSYGLIGHTNDTLAFGTGTITNK